MRKLLIAMALMALAACDPQVVSPEEECRPTVVHAEGHDRATLELCPPDELTQ